jgi:hypothetical protein
MRPRSRAPPGGPLLELSHEATDESATGDRGSKRPGGRFMAEVVEIMVGRHPYFRVVKRDRDGARAQRRRPERDCRSAPYRGGDGRASQTGPRPPRREPAPGRPSGKVPCRDHCPGGPDHYLGTVRWRAAVAGARDIHEGPPSPAPAERALDPRRLKVMPLSGIRPCRNTALKAGSPGGHSALTAAGNRPSNGSQHRYECGLRVRCEGEIRPARLLRLLMLTHAVADARRRGCRSLLRRQEDLTF